MNSETPFRASITGSRTWKQEARAARWEQRSETLRAIKQCIISRNLEQAQQVHSRARALGIDSNLFVASSLVAMYSKCGSMVEARRVFDQIPTGDVTLWTTLILGYAENGEPEIALELFYQMLLDTSKCCQPDARAFVAALKACSSLAGDSERKLEALDAGFSIFSQAASRGLGFTNNFVANSMINLLAKCGCLMDARQLLNTMHKPDIVSWNSLLLGFAECGDERSALELYVELRSSSLQPNARTFAAVLKSCSSLAAKEKLEKKKVLLEIGMALHSDATRFMCDSESFVASTLVDMYSNCGSLEDAKRVFDGMSSRTLVSWNSLLMGYAESGHAEETLDLFFLNRDLQPDCRSFAAALKASGMIPSIQATKRVHSEICRSGLEMQDVLVGSLIDSYGKCGRVSEARSVFDSVSCRELICWSSLLDGYSRGGDPEKVFEMFKRMREEGLRADPATILIVLSACSHSGNVERGKKCFQMMEPEFGVAPSAEHYDCFLDMLGRANQLDEALAIVESLPSAQKSEVTWKTILAACRQWKNVELERIAFQSLAILNEELKC